MPTPISGPVTPRTQTIDMDAINVPPPRTPASGGAAPPRGPSPTRDEFSARPSTTNSAQGASATNANPRAQLRAELELTRTLVEQIALPPARRPSVEPPRQTLAELIEHQHQHAFTHGLVETALSLPGAGMLARGMHHARHAAEAVLIPAHTGADLVLSRGAGHGPGETLAQALTGAGVEVLDGALGAEVPMLGAALNMARTAEHMLHDGHERARVAGEESAYRAAQQEVAQQDAYSRMDGRNAANGVGNARTTDALDYGRLGTDRAYAVAVRQTLEQRLQTLPR